MNTFLDNDVKYIKGIGERLAKILAADMDIRTVRDLLFAFPIKYIDRSRYWNIAEFIGDMPHVQIKGEFTRFVTEGEGAKKRLIGLFTDGQRCMEVVWFSRIKQIEQTYLTGKQYILFGKPSLFNHAWSMAHPEIDSAEKTDIQTKLHAVYSISEKARKHNITQRSMRKWIENALSLPQFYKCPETLPSDIISASGLLPLQQALKTIHSPQSTSLLEKAKYRFKFEELFYIQLHILRHARRNSTEIHGAILNKVGPLFNDFYNNILPFPLTSAQKRVMHQIRKDLISGRQMNRLLQGDVGSGKTLVAFMAALLAIDNHRQTAIMAPTEILATQHYSSLQPWCRQLGINIALLTGSTSKKERTFIHEALLDKSIHLLIGTHALIEENVKFADLGLAIIDEQHRFGVAQRARMWQKNNIAPHMLVMTATPIPRTLAMTLYGDLDVSVIDELPPGRKPVKTQLFLQNNKNNVWRLVASQLKAGRQAYVVYPLIKENEKLNLRSLEEGYSAIHDIFGRYYRIAYVHGQMKPAEKDYQMQLFASGKAAILVATTVIEVGVNVPNATVMVIESAERFGLSQLHQLRGRVGRGAEMSYCALVAKEQLSNDTRRRLELMTATNDGFEIAEADMKMRGPGDIDGTLQSGLPFNLRIASLSTDGNILASARTAASQIIQKYPAISIHNHDTAHTSSSQTLTLLNYELYIRFGKAINWSNIS